MAQKLLLNVLVQVLGEFVEGLSEENLKLGVWSGKIVLQNLQLNRTSIQKLNLPVSVTNGSVKRVEIIIPWTSLESQPVKIDMSGIFLQVGPLVVKHLDPADVSARALENKRHKLDAAEKLALPEDDDKNGSNKSYFQRLTAKIIDNLEIRLHDMHIRYEDAQTIPGKVFSAGITVDSFVVATTDGNWVESFVARTESTARAAIHKLATMRNLTIYWNSDSAVLCDLSTTAWQNEMMQLVYSPRNMSTTEHLDYLLAPPNKLSVKLTHNEYIESAPKFDIVVESTMINFHVDKGQYHQIMRTKNQFALADRMQRLFLRRPFSRPSRSTAKEWWVYAVRRVLNRENVGGNDAWLNFQRCVRYRKRYIDLIVKSKRSIPNPRNPKETISAINAREETELLDMEKLLPLQALMMYRQFAAVEAKKERLTEAINNPSPKPATSSWFGWGKASAAKSAAEAEEEIETLEKVKAQLDSGFKIDSLSPSTQQTWRFVLRSSGDLNVTNDSRAVAAAKMALKVEAEMTLAGGICAKFSLDELKMRDLFTPTPLFPHLIKVPNASASSAKLMITFESNDGVSNIRVDALPLEIAWNKPCIQQILDIVTVPKLEPVTDTSDPILLAASLVPAGKKKKNEDGEMNFIFEAAAPKIIIPDDCSSDCGFLYLDAGKLSVRGQMKGDEGMSWNVVLSSINANMPSSVGESTTLNSAGDTTSSSTAYLIKPFNISVDVQTLDNSKANMTVDVNISPGVKAELDAVKLARVLDFSKLVSSTFDNLEAGGNVNREHERLTTDDSTPQDDVPPELLGVVKAHDDKDDASQYKMIIKVAISVVTLDLHYDTVNGHHLIVSASQLFTDVRTRVFDFQASFAMNSISIEDSSRPLAQRELAWTHMEDEDDNLISVSFASINHKRSPLFKGFGTETNVAFGSLCMNADTKTLMHMRPFYEVLLGKRFEHANQKATAGGRPGMQRVSGSRVLQQKLSAAVASSGANKPRGNHVICTLGKIKLELLKPKVGDSPYVYKGGSTKGNGSRPSSAGSQVSFVHDDVPAVMNLDSIVALEMSGLFTEVEMVDLIHAKVTIHSFEIFDTRATSEDYEFRTLFRPDFNLADNSKPSTPGYTTATASSNDSPVKSGTAGSKLSTPAKPQAKKNLFELVFKQHSKQNSVVDIVIGNVTSYFSLDIILELVDISVANSLAVVALVAPVDTDNGGTNDLTFDEGEKRQFNNSKNDPKSSIESSPTSNVMTVCVLAPNLRLILLEDPTSPDTRAVVGRCGIDVQYSRDVSNGALKEINESLHVSVVKAEVFVMMTMVRWNPLQILEPVGAELHYKQCQDKGVVLMRSLALDVDAMDARVSLNDVILAQAIAARGLTSNNGNVAPTEKARTSDAVTVTTDGPPTVITAYNLQLSLGEVSLVIVNDFNGQNLPIIRFMLKGTTFTADGALQNLNGAGSLIVGIEYFNPRVFSWEPILEPWFPALSLSTGSDGTTFEISETSDIMQLSVTGTMLETLLRTYSLLLQADDTVDRSPAPAVTFQNLLGVPIEVFDGENKLFDLRDDAVMPVSRLQAVEHGQGSGLVRTAAQSARDFGIGFLDKMGEERRPLLNLPVHVSRPHSYEVLPIAPDATQRSNPVVEEVYEMERYQPLSGSWKVPFMMNDPPQWATIGYRPRDIAEIGLPSGGGWEWQGQWTVEIAPQPRKGERGAEAETDAAGWEYAANFSALSSSNKRRGTAQTFDYVRRRRWIRTRVPVYKHGSDSVRPLTLFWDVKLLATGCRQILIRSGFQIKNTLSFKILVKLTSNVYNSEFVFGPIDSEDTFSVPLLYANSSSMCIRPSADDSFQWSQKLQCGQNVVDFERPFDVYCSGTQIPAVYFRALIAQLEKTTVVTISPYLNLQNRLPCSLKYRIVSSVPRNPNEEPVPVEQGALDAGASTMLFHIADMGQARISFSAGSLDWSPYIYLVGGKGNRVSIAIPTDRGPAGMFLSLKIDAGKDNVQQIDIFSQAALVDRSNLDICVKSVFKDKREMIRRSSARNNGDPGAASTTSVRFVAVDPKSEDIVAVTNFSCKSHHQYVLTTGRHGDFVYVDNNFVWTYLPDYFFGHSCIRTASADRQMRAKELMVFEVECRSMVFVLHDSHVDQPPKWMTANGFHRIIEQAIARHVVNNVVIEHHYSIFGKIVEPGVKIALGQNSASASVDMYSVFILPDMYDKLRDQLQFENNMKADDASNSWVDGTNGLSLFSYHNHTVSFGIQGGEYWSSDLHMKKISSGKSPFDVVDTKTNRSYQLCYSVQSMPGKYHRTHLTTVMPHYCVVNCMDEPIEVRQVGTRRTTYVPSYHTEGWHKAEAEKGTQIQIKTNSSVWSYGSVDINEIGSTVFLLPLVDGSNAVHADRNPIILHVEIKLAEAHENCAVTVIVWKEEVDSATAYSIRNDSSHPVALQQAKVNFSGVRPELISRFELCVPPGVRIPFGWTDPNASSSVLIAMGNSLLAAGKRAAEISFLETGQALRISNGHTNGEVIMCVVPFGSGKVLHIVDKAEDLSLLQLSLNAKKSLSNIVTSLKIHRLGISLVLDRPTRREFLSFHLKDVLVQLSSSPEVNSTEVKVDDFQMDNYSETAVYPVMLHCIKPNVKEVEDGDLSAIKFCAVKVNSGLSTQHYRYVALRVLPIAVEIDSASIELVVDDFVKFLNVVSRDEAMATFSPQKWIKEFNMKLLSPEQRKQLVDVYHSQMSAQGQKLFLENFVLHPMKFNLSFQKTRFPRDRETKATDFIAAFASVDRMEIKLSSFIVINVMESAATLKTRIVAKLGQDLQSQIAQIAGSLSILGSPAGFARNVGNGVQAFFYEPAQGLVQGPQDFVLGIGKGTTSLVSGVVSGALNSTAGVIRNVSSGLSLLSGDQVYIEDRNKSRQQATRGGMASGFKGGGESVVSGFTSGVTGLFTKPFEEAQKDGAFGFVRGVGMGVFGAAVKPVIGVTDGITHMAQGISNQLSDTVEKKHFRPPRAFSRSEADPTELVLPKFDINAAYCQAFVVSKASKMNIEDAFVDLVMLDKKTEARVVMSEKYLYWNISRERLWNRPWTSISHCTFIPPQSVGVVVYETSGKNEIVPIACKGVEVAAELYRALALNSFRMGNPRAVASFDSIFGKKDRAGGKLLKPKEGLHGYDFGSANDEAPIEVPSGASLSSHAIIDRATERLRVVTNEDWAALDAVCWSMICEWGRGHSGLRASLCCCLLLINMSNETIQINRTQLVEGKSIFFLPGEGYDENSKTISTGGFVVLFGVSAASTLSGSVVLNISTSVADIVVSSKLSSSSCENKRGSHGGFMEKSVSDMWSKYVVCITK